MKDIPAAFWTMSADLLIRTLETNPEGLTQGEALARRSRIGLNVLSAKKHSGGLFLFLSQFKSPIILILIFAAGLSFFLHDPADALIILSIVLVIRSRRPFFKSTPSRYLITATLTVVALSLIIPFTPLGKAAFDFTRLPASFLLIIGGIVLAYVFGAEAVKKRLYGRLKG